MIAGWYSWLIFVPSFVLGVLVGAYVLERRVEVERCSAAAFNQVFNEALDRMARQHAKEAREARQSAKP